MFSFVPFVVAIYFFILISTRMTLAGITSLLRKRLTEYRHAQRFDTKMHAPINIMETALNITELAIDKSRPIKPDEEYWFDEAWPLIHKLEMTEWDDLVDLYRELGFKVKERNWFRVD